VAELDRSASRVSRPPRLSIVCVADLEESHSQLLFALANYLQTEPVDSIRTQLGAALMQNDCVARARALAPVLLPHPGLSAAESLRIGLLQPADENPLPLFSAAIEEWLNELNGPFQSESQIELMRQGAATLATLVRHWDRLLESSKKWLLQWAAEIDADLVIDAIRKVLAKETDAIALAALEAAANLKNFPADLEILIAPFLEDSDPLVRRAAIRSCRSASDWRLFFEKEPSALVRQTCIAKVIDQEGMNAVPFVLQQLANPDWRIRAAAAEGLLLLGNPGVRAAITILPEASASARISIGRMVIYSADEGLLDEFIRSCPH
jgi:HEAT repeat protein